LEQRRLFLFFLVDKLHETGLPQKGTFGKPSWFDNVRAEYWACREGVCLIDMSTFAKFELRVSLLCHLICLRFSAVQFWGTG